MEHKNLTIYISGLYSGPNPSPGVGVARSLRVAFPHATLIGVGYSNRSSGIHWRDFDDVWLQRPWDELNLNEYIGQIWALLERGAYWISGLDLETQWLSQVIEHPRLLTPNRLALRHTAKPDIPFHAKLPLRVPPFIYSSSGENKVYEFCVHHGWPVWVKGPWYEAILAHSWMEVKSAYMRLSTTWATDDLFVQKYIVGYEESIAFAAYQGTLLDSAYMRKRAITPEGKAWAGKISKVPVEFTQQLQQVVAQLGWTGGAELESVRDSEHIRWLIDWNPRFPAWIFGSTIAGRNLPAKLVAAACGWEDVVSNQMLSEEFTRVVIEVPVKRAFPLPPLTEPSSINVMGGNSFKHPSGMPLLAKKMEKTIDGIRSGQEGVVPERILEDLLPVNFDTLETPTWLFFETMAHAQFQELRDIVASLSEPGLPQLRVAYSIKTNPDRRLLHIARNSSFFAEAISQREIEVSIAAGFSLDQIILNGPGKWWPHRINHALRMHAIFCDSLEELNMLASLSSQKMQLPRFIGVRLRPPQSISRFGISVGSFPHFTKLIQSIQKLPECIDLALHFHIQSSTIGTFQWYKVFSSMLHWGQTIETLSDRKIRLLDVGGGFLPGELQNELHQRGKRILSQVAKLLPNVQEVLLEPGKALAQPTMGVATRVLDVRKDSPVEIIVDASVAELPEIFNHPHRILWYSAPGKWIMLKQLGSDRILGRLCMEIDFLGHVDAPSQIKEGDILVFLDAGAYDRSMSYVFGQGYSSCK